MKKVLFATTALVATAGMAAADVTFGGYGRFGIEYIDNDATNDDSTNLTSRLRLQIDTTAESDMGVTFGARVRFQSNQSTDAAGNPTSDPFDANGVRFFARSGGLEVGVGNIFGAIESMASSYPIDLGLTGLGYDYTPYTGADGYSSAGNGAYGSNGVEVMYTIADFGVHLSASDTNDRVALAVDYTYNGWTLEAAYQDSTAADDTEYQVGVLGSFGAFNVSAAYAENGTNGGRAVLTGRYDLSAATNIEAYVVEQEGVGIYSAGVDTGYGIDFNHDMGGGTSLRGGVAKRINGNTHVDLGVRFNF